MERLLLGAWDPLLKGTCFWWEPVASSGRGWGRGWGRGGGHSDEPDSLTRFT